MPLPRLILIVLLFVIGGAVERAAADDASEPTLNRRFAEQVEPFLKTYCHECHGGQDPEAGLNLTAYRSLDSVAKDWQTWDIVLERLEAAEMPPKDASRQPSADARGDVIDWFRAVRRFEADRNAGDPGAVTARRLSNAEYNYTIRDLTGVDIQPAREFPVDPANEAGFDNTAESLTMSPALMQKHLEAARRVAEHLVLRPKGFTFAPHPVTTDTDRDKYCVKRIVEFYQRQPIDLADYFFAAWKYRHRNEFGQEEASLADLAAADHISPKYLASVWSTLTEATDAAGPLSRLQSLWRELPPPDPSRPNRVRDDCEQMREYVKAIRRKLEPQPKDLDVDGIHKGAQPFVLWKNGQYAAGRRTFNRDALKSSDDPHLAPPPDEAQRAKYEAALEKFCSIFPDAFYISERGRDYVGKAKDEQEKGRLLSAGFHSMMGYYRDDAPLYDLMLDEAQQAELDELWRELDFVTGAPMRQYSGFLWFERTDSRYMRDPEFDFARAEDKNAAAEKMIGRLAKVYLEKAIRSGAEGDSVKAIQDYFTNINAQIRWVEDARLAAEPSHLEALLEFARRAYRRPLTAAERQGFLEFYRSLREEELTHEEAMQDAVVAVLLSPHFAYRMDLLAASEGKRPLNDDELASRLSYFLWSSMPDERLLSLAAEGKLRDRAVLAAEARRMMQDDRIRGLAVEFGGAWLDFRRFQEHNSVDRERFPSFTNELRQAMFEEPVHFFIDVVRNDRPVLDFLEARHTFVNVALARHYGVPEDSAPGSEWTRIDDATPYGRGGLLPMAVFLTQNSPGLRTSPVKRGYWVVRRLLGERIPPPPPNVPELPADEAKLGELTLRETLARHRERESCAGCHRRFDSIGLTLEGFGPIGELRQTDLGGRPVETHAVFPDGSEGAGLDGLRSYLRQERQEEFLDNLCRKLLSYALNRTLAPSDDSTIEQMRRNLAAEEYPFGALLETIIASPQFLTKRGGD
jgi:hypothetical protein